jgi:parallel beta-helix repeat protein
LPHATNRGESGEVGQKIGALGLEKVLSKRRRFMGLVQRVKVGAAAMGVALLGAVLVPAASAHAAVRNVAAGQSIQAAVNAASPGDTIRVASGVFRESVEVTKSLTIIGAGVGNTVLQPPTTTPTQGFPCQDPSAPGELNGFCVHGTIDQNTFEVTSPIGAVRISGFTVKNFGFTGVLFWGVSSPQGDHNQLVNNTEYGTAAFGSTNTRLTDNIANKNGEAGLYVGDSPNANAVVTGNQATNQNIGIFVRDASGASAANPGKVANNLVRGNCIGMLFLNTGSGEAHWEASGNQSSANNAFCPPDEDPESVSGVGIAVFGPDDIFVHDNLVTNNVPSQPADISGGIVVGGGATNIRVARNDVRRNQPDLFWDQSGSATFTNNTCKTSVPNGLC